MVKHQLNRDLYDIRDNLSEMNSDRIAVKTISFWAMPFETIFYISLADRAQNCNNAFSQILSFKGQESPTVYGDMLQCLPRLKHKRRSATSYSIIR